MLEGTCMLWLEGAPGILTSATPAASFAISLTSTLAPFSLAYIISVVCSLRDELTLVMQIQRSSLCIAASGVVIASSVISKDCYIAGGMLEH